MTPYVPGISKLPRTDFSQEEKLYGKTSDEYYQATQVQRRLERQVRKYKRRIALGEERGEDMTGDRARLGQAQKKVRQWCKQNKLPRQLERERAYGVAKQPRALGHQATKEALKLSRYAGAVADRGQMAGTNTSLVNSQIKAIDSVADKVPALARSIKERSLTFSTCPFADNTAAETVLKNGKWVVVFDTRIFSSPKSFKAVVESIKSGHLMPASKTGTKGYIAVHEAGHITERALFELATGKSDDELALLDFAKDVRAQIENIARTCDGGTFLSSYAHKSDKEFFAECFANAFSGAPNAYGKAMIKFLGRWE